MIKQTNKNKKPNEHQEIIQDKHENLSQFLDHFTNIPILQYSNLDPETPDGKQLHLPEYF